MKAFTMRIMMAGIALALVATARADLILHYNFEPGTTPDDGISVFHDVSPVQQNDAVAGGGNDANIEPAWDSERGNVEYLGTVKNIAVNNANGIAAADTFTVAAWFKGTVTGYLFDQSSPRLALSVGYNVANEGLGVFFGFGSFYSTDITSAKDGSWHHIAFVFTHNGTDGVFSIYLDGVAQDVDPEAGGVQFTRTMTGKGKASLVKQATNYQQRFCSKFDGTTPWLNGLYDDIQVYNTALTAAEVLALYNATAPGGEASYARKLRGMNPLELYRLRGAKQNVGTGSAVPAAISLGQTNAPALAPAAGYPGLEAQNSWAYFPGTNGALTSLVTNWNSTAGTILYWIRMDGAGDATQTTLFSRASGGDTDFARGVLNGIATFHRTNGDLGIYIDGAGVTSVGKMTMNAWHLQAFTWERNSGVGDGVLRAYLDGKEVGSATDKSWGAFSITEARFGKEIDFNSVRRLKGSADELAIWTRALTATEIDTLWRIARGIPMGTRISFL